MGWGTHGGGVHMEVGWGTHGGGVGYTWGWGTHGGGVHMEVEYMVHNLDHYAMFLSTPPPPPPLCNVPSLLFPLATRG